MLTSRQPQSFKPAASAVMATNSTSDLIEPAIRALQAQTYLPFEIIVVMDREVKQEEQEALALRFPGIIFEFLGASKRLPTALNAGIRRATGEIIIRCDDDDICVPERVAKQVSLILERNLDFCWSEAVGKRPDNPNGWLISCPADDGAIKAALLRRNILVHSSLAMRKSAVERIGLYNPAFIRAQDYELYLRALRAGLTFGAVAEPLVTRFYSNSSITVKHRKNQIMFSFAAQMLHAAHRNDLRYLLRKVAYYSMILLTPNFIRDMRRRIGTISRRGA